MSDLPPSWLEIELGEAVDYGKTTKAEPSELRSNDWILELEDIEKDTSKLLARVIFGDRRSKSTKNRFSTGDVLYGKLRPYLNKVVRADRDGFCTTEIVPLKPNSAVDGGYLYHWLRHPRFIEYVTSVSHGLNMPRLGTDDGKKAPFILAPINEQTRIAAKLDDLTQKLTACRERMERVPQILKKFREAVLEAAVSGMLTEEWRGERGLSSKDWRHQTFEDASEYITVGHVGKMSSEYIPSGVPFLRSLNVRPFRFDTKNLLYVSKAFHRSLPKSSLRPGDVVVVRTGAPGQCCVIPTELVEANCSDLVIVRPRDSLNPKFACIYINSSLSQRFVRSEQVGVAQLHFNVGSMKRTPLLLPSLIEQSEIARRVEELFALADSLDVRYESLLSRIKYLTPSVLAKAFRGELVPQDPNDEPAGEMLKRLHRPLTSDTTAFRGGKATRK